MNHQDFIEKFRLLLNIDAPSLSQTASIFGKDMSHFKESTSTKVVTVYKCVLIDNESISAIEIKIDNFSEKPHYISFILKNPDNLESEDYIDISGIEPADFEIIPELNKVTKSYIVNGVDISFSSEINNDSVEEITIVYQ